MLCLDICAEVKFGAGGTEINTLLFCLSIFCRDASETLNLNGSKNEKVIGTIFSFFFSRRQLRASKIVLIENPGLWRSKRVCGLT